jgi:hypothetical protein
MRGFFTLPILIGLSLAGGLQQPGAARDTSVKAVVAAAAAYVRAYERNLTSILADEAYTQRIVRQVPRDEQMAQQRMMTSEIFFMFAERDRAWMAIRDVMAVDGKPVADRPDLRAALQSLPASEVAETFKAHNSRYNIGRVVRNFNEPTLALLVLDDTHRDRFRFSGRGIDRRGGAPLVTVAFEEKDRPTLIRDFDGRQMFSKGELKIDVGTGRVEASVLRLALGSIEVELATEYSPDERLNMWVPHLFRERYRYSANMGPAANAGQSRDRPVHGTGEYEEILCEAKYTNFRRFETTVRIK